LRKERKQSADSLRVMCKESSQWQVRLQPNAVGIDDQTRRDDSSQWWYGDSDGGAGGARVAVVGEGGSAGAWLGFAVPS
jgi:hypothetical protein